MLTSPDTAIAALQDLADRPFLFGAVLVGLSVVRAFLGWPTVALSAVVGFGYGIAGLPVALCGVVITSAPPFYAARWFTTESSPDGPSVLERLGESGDRYLGATGDVRGITAARLAPIPADVVSAAAGLSTVGFGVYAVGTLLGEIPWTIAAVFIGSSARNLTVSGLDELSLPLAIGTGLAALVLLAGPIYNAVKRDDHQKVSEQS